MKDRALFLSTSRLRRTAAMAAITALTVLAGCAGSPPQAAAMAPHAAHATATTNEGISPSFTVSGAVGKRATFDLAALQA